MIRTISLAIVTALLLISEPATAQPATVTSDYEVPPLSNYIAEYRDKRRVILEAINAMPGNTEARLDEYERQIGKLRDAFRAARLAEYKAVNPERTVEKSCTSGVSGGVTNCGYACTVSPSADHYPVPETLRVEGTNKGTKIEKGGACLKMTVAGKGRNVGTLHVNYRFKPEVIERRLNDDTKELFNLIGTRG